MSPFKPTNKLGQFIMSVLHGYNHERYWRYRSYVVNPLKKSILRKLLYLYYIKRTDCRLHSSFGTNVDTGAVFKSAPILPHIPNGILIGGDVIIGKNVVIFQQVTVMDGMGKRTTIIGDNVILGAGCKVLPGVHIGNNAKVGANCVVVDDIPDNSTCVLQKPRIISKMTEL